MGPRTQNLLKFAINNSFRLKQEKAEEEKREKLLKRIRELRKAREMQLNLEKNNPDADPKKAETVKEKDNLEAAKNPEPKPETSKKDSDSGKPLPVTRFRARSSESCLFRIFKDKGTIKKKKKSIRNQRFLLMSRSSLRAAKLVQVSNALREMVDSTKSGKNLTCVKTTSGKTSQAVVDSPKLAESTGSATVPANTASDDAQREEANLENDSSSIAADLIEFLIEMVVGKSEPAVEEEHQELDQPPKASEGSAAPALKEAEAELASPDDETKSSIGLETSDAADEEKSSDEGMIVSESQSDETGNEVQLDQDQSVSESETDSMIEQLLTEVDSDIEAASTIPEIVTEKSPEKISDMNRADEVDGKAQHGSEVQAVEVPLKESEPVSSGEEEKGAETNHPQEKSELKLEHGLEDSSKAQEPEPELEEQMEVEDEHSGELPRIDVTRNEVADDVQDPEMAKEPETGEDSNAHDTPEVFDRPEEIENDASLKVTEAPSEQSEVAESDQRPEMTEKPATIDNLETTPIAGEPEASEICENGAEAKMIEPVQEVSEEVDEPQVVDESSVSQLLEVVPPVEDDLTSEGQEDILAPQEAATEVQTDVTIESESDDKAISEQTESFALDDVIPKDTSGNEFNTHVQPDGPILSDEDVTNALIDTPVGEDLRHNGEDGVNNEARGSEEMAAASNAKPSIDENANENLDNKTLPEPETATEAEQIGASEEPKDRSDLSPEKAADFREKENFDSTDEKIRTPKSQTENTEKAATPLKSENVKVVKGSNPRRSDLTETPSTRTRSRLSMVSVKPTAEKVQAEGRKSPKISAEKKADAIESKALTEKPSARTRSKLSLSSAATKALITEGPTKSKAFSEKPSTRTRSKLTSASAERTTKKVSLKTPEKDEAVAAAGFKLPHPVTTKTKRTLDFDEVTETSHRRTTRSRMSLGVQAREPSSTVATGKSKTDRKSLAEAAPRKDTPRLSTSSRRSLAEIEDKEVDLVCTPIRSSRTRTAQPEKEGQKNATKPSSVATQSRSLPPVETTSKVTPETATASPNPGIKAGTASSRASRRSAASSMGSAKKVNAEATTTLVPTTKRNLSPEETSDLSKPKKSRFIDQEPHDEVPSVDRKRKRPTLDNDVADETTVVMPPQKNPRMSAKEHPTPAVTTRSRKSTVASQDQQLLTPTTRQTRSKRK